jgi:hypothetical protein
LPADVTGKLPESPRLQLGKSTEALAGICKCEDRVACGEHHLMRSPRFHGLQSGPVGSCVRAASKFILLIMSFSIVLDADVGSETTAGVKKRSDFD